MLGARMKLEYAVIVLALAVSIYIGFAAPSRPVIKPGPAAIPACGDSDALIALLNERRVSMSDGSYATCRIHHLPKGEHIDETL